MPASAEATSMLPGLSPLHGRAIEARFDAALMSSDGGLLILREIEQRTALATRLADCITDPRAPERTQHGLDEVRPRSRQVSQPPTPNTVEPATTPQTEVRFSSNGAPVRKQDAPWCMIRARYLKS